ncbi:hypothetical protein KQH31_31325, partial [Streptomyces sp. CHA15]|nr:hypothetical protein [Streptomyces sp. CHA15]
MNFILSGTDKVGKLTYQDFRVQLKADNVTELSMRPENGTYRVEGTLAKAIPGQESNKFFTN